MNAQWLLPKLPKQDQTGQCNQDQTDTLYQGYHQLDQSLGHNQQEQEYQTCITVQGLPPQDRTGAVQNHPLEDQAEHTVQSHTLLDKGGPIIQCHLLLYQAEPSVQGRPLLA